MPIYAYLCQACGHQFDLMQKMSDPAPEQCPGCGKAEVKKQLTAPGFQLKGNGWYATDFRGGQSAAKTESGDSTPPACGGGGCGCH